MGKKYLIALDLEGVNYVVGVPYEGLHRGTEQYEIAVNEAVREVNAIAQGLFLSDAESVTVWDNHGGGGNIDPRDIDGRCVVLSQEESESGLRMDFADKYGFDAIFFVGYHSMEGTIGGVLAHTMSSECVQYMKIGGKEVGEIAIDSYIAGEKGIVPCLVVSDDKGCDEARRFIPDVVTVETKTGLSRNSAGFCDDTELMGELVAKSMMQAERDFTLLRLHFPNIFEIRYTRTERAAEALRNASEKYSLCAAYNGDAHTVAFFATGIDDIKKALKS